MNARSGHDHYGMHVLSRGAVDADVAPGEGSDKKGKQGQSEGIFKGWGNIVIQKDSKTGVQRMQCV